MKRAQMEQLNRIKEHVVNRFAIAPGIKQRVVTKVAKIVILNAPYLLNGKMWDIKSKNLGAGVYELSLKEVE